MKIDEIITATEASPMIQSIKKNRMVRITSLNRLTMPLILSISRSEETLEVLFSMAST